MNQENSERVALVAEARTIADALDELGCAENAAAVRMCIDFAEMASADTMRPEHGSESVWGSFRSTLDASKVLIASRRRLAEQIEVR
jgi:hypothetical protein